MTRDPLDGFGLRDQGLAQLLGHLTSGPAADELAGEYQALTMFRAARNGPTATVVAGTVPPVWATQSAPLASPRRARRAQRRRRSRARVGSWLVAGATVIAFGGGFAAAGYAEVLPAPLQQVAHQILGFAGVPNPPPGSRAPTLPVTSKHSTVGSSGPTGSNSPSPNPGSSGGASHSPRSGSPSPRHSPHASPSHGWSASPTPSPNPTLPTPPISITLVQPQHGNGADTLLVSAPEAQPGDVVTLEDLVGGQWQVIRQNPLRVNGQTSFSVAARKISVTYRVVLSATAKHNQSVSSSVTIAPRQNKGGGKG